MPPADTVNAAGGIAYKLSPEEALAQYCATGMFGSTFYASAQDQLSEVVELAKKCDPRFVAKCAVYSRKHGYMKDMPAVLLATLSVRSQEMRVVDGVLQSDHQIACRALRAAFPHVIDNYRMLSNYYQVLKSGALGRKSLGKLPKRLMQQWLLNAHPVTLFNAQFGIPKPGIREIIRYVNPRALSKEQIAMFGYLTGPATREYRPRSPESRSRIERRIAASRMTVESQDENSLTVDRYQPEFLPAVFRAYEAFKAAKLAGKPADVSFLTDWKVDFRAVDSLGLTRDEWEAVGRRAGVKMALMNINTFARQGLYGDDPIFRDTEFAKEIAKKISDPAEILEARLFPHEVFKADRYATEAPIRIRGALIQALENSITNVPELSGNTVVCVDVSGSMDERVSKGSSTRIEVAAVFAAALFKRNPGKCRILAFNTDSALIHVSTEQSAMHIAGCIIACLGGGTSLSSPICYLNGANPYMKLMTGLQNVIMISDNESWADPNVNYGYAGPSTTFAREWSILKSRNPEAKLVMIDLEPKANTQAPSAPDRLNVGGFNDSVFRVVSSFLEPTKRSRSHWVDEIESINLMGC